MITFPRLARRLPPLYLFASLTGVSAANAQQFLPNKYTDPQTQEVLEYNVVLPPGYDAAADTKYPLWVCLHAASNTSPPNRTLSADGKCYVSAFTDAKHPAFFMVPISQSNMSGWGDAGSNSPISQAEKFEGRLTVVVVKRLLTQYKIDEDRLYIAGPSMGARGTWDIIRRNPTLFAAAAPAAGPADPRDAALYASQNIWAINGSNDSTAAENTAAIEAIRAAGGNPIYTLLQNRGHDTWRSVFNDAQLVCVDVCPAPRCSVVAVAARPFRAVVSSPPLAARARNRPRQPRATAATTGAAARGTPRRWPVCCCGGWPPGDGRGDIEVGSAARLGKKTPPFFERDLPAGGPNRARPSAPRELIFATPA